MSQLALSLEAGVSTKHLSFIETGKTRPSRGLMTDIMQALDLPPRDRNELLLAAGFAPQFRETPLTNDDMKEACAALALVLSSVEPFGAVAVDQEWKIVMANRAYVAWGEGLWPKEIEPLKVMNEPRIDLLELLFSETGLRTRIRNWPLVAAGIAERVTREAARKPTHQRRSLLARMPTGVDAGEFQRLSTQALLPIELALGDTLVHLVNTICTLGAAIDLSLRDLKIEMFHPVDDASRRAVIEWTKQNKR